MSPTRPHRPGREHGRRGRTRALSVLLAAGAGAALLLAPSLSPAVGGWARDLARAREGHAPIDVYDGCSTLPAFNAAFATSGTVTLECALAEVPPVIVYRTDPLTGWLARLLLETPYVGLPNAILGRAAFPELLQNRMNAATLANEMQHVLRRPDEYREA